MRFSSSAIIFAKGRSGSALWINNFTYDRGVKDTVFLTNQLECLIRLFVRQFRKRPVAVPLLNDLPEPLPFVGIQIIVSGIGKNLCRIIHHA